MTSVAAIIPARFGSTRLPAKPLADICGKPMIQRVCEQVSKSPVINRVIVATDDMRIATVVEDFGGEVIMTSVDIQSGSDRCAAVAKQIEADIIVNVQGDEPLISPVMIDEAVQPFLQDPMITMGTVVRQITNEEDLKNPSVVKAVLDLHGNALYFTRSVVPYIRDNESGENWVTQHAFYKHFGLYVYKKNFLLTYTQLKPTPLEKAERLEQLRVLEYGYKIHCVITNEESIAVDTPDDLERVRKIYQQKI